MLSVIPIQDKNMQKELCELCGAEYSVNSFAYRADDGRFLGICQFSFENGCGKINALKTAPDVKDDEAMIIMLRAAMNFMFRCGIELSEFADNAAPNELLEISGYRKDERGIYSVNLKKFYISPCHYE